MARDPRDDGDKEDANRKCPLQHECQSMCGVSLQLVGPPHAIKQQKMHAAFPSTNNGI